MSDLKTIGNKLFKTELGSQRVELGLTQDIVSVLKQNIF
jgi:hypothetical protein